MSWIILLTFAVGWLLGVVEFAQEVDRLEEELNSLYTVLEKIQCDDK